MQQDVRIIMGLIDRMGGKLEHLVFDATQERLRAEWVIAGAQARRYDLLNVGGDATVKVFSLNGGWGAAEIETAEGEFIDVIARLEE